MHRAALSTHLAAQSRSPLVPAHNNPLLNDQKVYNRSCLFHSEDVEGCYAGTFLTHDFACDIFRDAHMMQLVTTMSVEHCIGALRALYAAMLVAGAHLAVAHEVFLAREFATTVVTRSRQRVDCAHMTQQMTATAEHFKALCAYMTFCALARMP